MPLKAKNISGRIASKETWSETITLTGNVSVENGTLRILPGTYIDGNKAIDIIGAGSIQAVGIASNDIILPLREI